ncbi:hypothetical protein GobsT_26150 [Gemmata obscuriglobus]|uniref:DUF3854 domain-containing protein n=1 Tax=Gemmata obscuriglobus TaxID=114 RepID=A0A2Z3GXA0_9BACT|nr:DUF3854 domain-containing protein [Gemmata obscuriglobus]AWM39109.1 DUF3854 domain-containing protein [Gemmata obscuriglobus]QEG27851.1 hypothetical protein GobsT_26150 [Gemmata obscuriglobus]VTS05228.1 Uncultured bacterium genome assembly Metasoil_fosmids_resub OS=uncultured bacterium PE=4 SV=1: DUF3854 [Gemmata obscuriglobus UQM 2246]
MKTVPDSARSRNPGLLPQHRADLHASGLTDGQIAACGFYSESDPEVVAGLLRGHFTPARAAKLGPCLAFPYHAPEGTPTGYVRLKPDRPRTRTGGDKVVKYEAPAGAPNRAYLPPGTRSALADPTVPLVLTEGEKKAAAADQHGFPCVGLSGVWAWQVKRPKDPHGRGTGPRQLIPDLARVVWAGRPVVLAFDSDVASNPQVRWAEWHLAEALRTAGAVVRVLRFPGGPAGEKVALDDVLVGRGAGALRDLIRGAGPPEPPAPDGGGPEIVLGTDEHRVNDEAVRALAAEPDLYQRGGMLVQVVSTEADAAAGAAVRRPPGARVVREVPLPLLRERLTRCARWVRYVGKEDEDYKPVHPPMWSVNAVHARGAWPGVRHLEAVVNHPVVLGNGALLAANGYNAPSKLLVCLPPDLHLNVSDRPTQRDAVNAVATLEDVLRDFPFANPAHRAAWLGGLLTPLAWFGFDGPAPMLLIDGNTRGVGKGLLADLIALILTGRRFAVMSYSADKEELRKKITSLAMEGERLVLLDNLAGAVGNDVLDMALTGDRWRDRVLGGNKVYDGPLHVTWVATGNNVQLAADTARRCSHCRLETRDERPELRTDVTYTDLRGHVRVNRGALLSAALTILRAWYSAGRPRHGLAPWGSFEGWSAVVREAVVFAGLPDPGEARLALQTSADRDAVAMEALLACLEQMDPNRRGVTTAEVIGRIRDTTGPAPDWVPELRAAVEELCGKLDGRALGGRFRHFQRRNFGGRMLCKGGSDRTNSNRWEVVPASGAEVRPGPVPEAPVPAGGAGEDGPDPARPQPSRAGPRYRSDDRPHDRRDVA